MVTLHIQSIVGQEERTTKDKKSTYRRIKFKAILDDNEIDLRTSIQHSQLKDLEQFVINYADDEVTLNLKPVKFNPDEMTKSKNPKKLLEFKKSNFGKFEYNYYELSPSVLIKNGFISGNYKVSLKNMFD